MSVDWGLLLAGLGTFLLGMNYLEQGLRGLMSQSSTNLLRRGTASLWSAIPLGTVLTALLQSSSLVGLLVLAFVGANIMPMRNALGIILGANLGTTFTGWMVTLLGFKLDLSGASLPLVGGGALAMFLFSEQAKLAALARLVLGFGLLLFGLAAMKDGVASITDHLDAGALAGMHSIWFLLVGMALAAIIQSSSAVVMLVLSGVYAGALPLPAALAAVIGADVGTSSTLLLASAGRSQVKRQVAVFHLIYNLASAAFSFLILLPIAPGGFAALGIDDPLICLVLFHSGFNFLGIFLFLPWLSRIADWLEQHVGETDMPDGLAHKVPPSVPEAALVLVEQECRRMLQVTSALLAQAFGLQEPGRGKSVPPGLPAYLSGYEALKASETRLLHYIADIPAQTPAQRDALQAWMACARQTVYASKSIKDIRDDLERLWALPAGEVRRALVEDAGLLLAALGSLLDEGLDSADIEALSHQHESNIQRLQEQLYERKLHTDMDISTLMNVVRETGECGRELERLMRRWPTAD